jgi:hypothetical protein
MGLGWGFSAGLFATLAIVEHAGFLLAALLALFFCWSFGQPTATPSTKGK